MQILVFGTVMYIIFVYTYYLPFLNCLIVMELKPQNRSINSSKLIFQWLHIPIHQPSVRLSVRPPFYIIIEQNNNWSLYPLSSFPDKSHTCFPRVGRIGGAGCALAPHLLWIYREYMWILENVIFLLSNVAPLLKFVSAYTVSRVGGTGGSGFAKGALVSLSFGDL